MTVQASTREPTTEDSMNVAFLREQLEAERAKLARVSAWAERWGADRPVEHSQHDQGYSAGRRGCGQILREELRKP